MRRAPWLALSALFACSADEPSAELAVALRSELVAGEEIGSVVLEVGTPLGATQPTRQEFATPAGFAFPFTLGITQHEEPLVRVTAIAHDPSGAVLLSRSVDAYFAAGALRFVELSLSRNCLRVSCAAGQTCEPSAGACAAIPTAKPIGIKLATPETTEWLTPSGLDLTASGAKLQTPSAEAQIREVQHEDRREFNARMQQWCDACGQGDGRFRCAWFLRSPYFSECEAEALSVGAKRLLPTYSCLLEANKRFTKCLSPASCDVDALRESMCSDTLEGEYFACYNDGELGPDARLDRCFAANQRIAGEEQDGMLFDAERIAMAECQCASAPAQCLSSWLKNESPRVRDCLAQATFAREHATRSGSEYALELELSCLQSALNVATGCVARASCQSDATQACLVQPSACGTSSVELLHCYREHRPNLAP